MKQFQGFFCTLRILKVAIQIFRHIRLIFQYILTIVPDKSPLHLQFINSEVHTICRSSWLEWLMVGACAIQTTRMTSRHLTGRSVPHFVHGPCAKHGADWSGRTSEAIAADRAPLLWHLCCGNNVMAPLWQYHFYGTNVMASLLWHQCYGTTVAVP